MSAAPAGSGPDSAPLDTRLALLERRLDRERRARQEAEHLLEARARELYEVNLDLRLAATELEARVGELESERARICEMARRDPLTGLLNRRAFADLLEAALARRPEADAPLALFSIDLDRFKALNDAHGHAMGDCALTVIARRLAQVFGQDAALARFGGDEFVALCPMKTGAGAADALAAAVVETLRRPIDCEGAQIRLGGSVGYALAPQHAARPSNLMRFADLALYQAKNAGRGRAARYEAALYSTILLRRELRRRLEAGIARGEIEAWFQPIVSARSPGRRKLEILARWRHPERGLIAPDLFVPLAEEAGIIAALDAAVLAAASAPLKGWFEQGLVQGASCNVSMCEFQEDGFAARFIEALGEHGLAPGQIIAEITETMIGEDLNLAQRHIGALSAAGVRVALDDFGTGYSNLRALADLPVDSLKLDRSLLCGAASDKRLGAFFQGAVKLAQAMGVSIIAEGVETRRQAAFARVSGCQDLQGFLYARPMPAAECADWLDARRHRGAFAALQR